MSLKNVGVTTLETIFTHAVLQGFISKKDAREILQRLIQERVVEETVAMTAEEIEAWGQVDQKQNPLRRQPGGSHYKDLKIQPIEYIHANKLGFLEGDIVKRITRLWLKGDRKHALQDLRKIQHECDLIIQLGGLDGS